MTNVERKIASRETTSVSFGHGSDSGYDDRVALHSHVVGVLIHKCLLFQRSRRAARSQSAHQTASPPDIEILEAKSAPDEF